jgi:hypothetical protein
MTPAQFVEHFAGRARPSADDIVHGLPESLEDIEAGRGIGQSPIGLRVLRKGLNFALDGEDHRPLALFHPLENSPDLRLRVLRKFYVPGEMKHIGNTPLFVCQIRRGTSP